MDKQEEQEYKRMGVDIIRPYSLSGRWVFEKDTRTYDFAPAQVVDAMLDPVIVGADKLISVGCRLKGIEEPEKGFFVLFSTNYFPNADVKLIFVESKFDGWVYSVEALNLKGVPANQYAWVCSYLKLQYSNPPENIFLRIEK
jgi:hypothetical protein